MAPALAQAEALALAADALPALLHDMWFRAHTAVWAPAQSAYGGAEVERLLRLLQEFLTKASPGVGRRVRVQSVLWALAEQPEKIPTVR